MHTLICGTTESGKTTLAHKLAEFDASAPEKERKEIIVYDPVLTETAAGTWPDSAAVFNDLEKFVRYVARKNGDRFAVYIDEAGDVFPQSDRTNLWIMTRGRHMGFSVTLICQRPKMVLPSARHQCARFCIFRLAHTDLREVAADTGHSKFNSLDLDNGDFVCAYSGHAEFTQANIFDILKERRTGPSWKNICNPPSSR